MLCFNYKKVAREAGITPSELAALCREIRAEFPADNMMFELHVLRACMAVRDGYAKPEDLLCAATVVSQATQPKGNEPG